MTPHSDDWAYMGLTGIAALIKTRRCPRAKWCSHSFNASLPSMVRFTATRKCRKAAGSTSPASPIIGWPCALSIRAHRANTGSSS